MAITYPLATPAASDPRRVTIRPCGTVGLSSSPFTFEQQIFVNQGEYWSLQADFPPMARADSEAWIGGFLLALNCREGTFLMGDVVNTSPRGTWSGSPLVNGASQSGKSLVIDGLGANVTIKAGDWFQLGSGATIHLHKVTKDTTANGAGQATLDLWPRLRASPADNDPLVLASAKGIWRLAQNMQEYSIELAQLYGVSFSAIEAL